MNIQLAAFTLLLPLTIRCMEPEDIRLDITSDNQKLSAQLITHIKSGHITALNEALTKSQTRAATTSTMPASLDQLVQALGYTKGEIAVQESQMAQKVFDTFTTRYRQTVIPLALCLACLANISINGYNFATSTITATQGTASFGVNMAASGFAALKFGYETWLQLRKGWTDHRQKKLVQQLQNSDLFIQLLQQMAIKDGKISDLEQKAIENAQIANVQLQVQLAQAMINAQAAAKAADANLSLQAPVDQQTLTSGTVATKSIKKKKRTRKTKSTGQLVTENIKLNSE